MHEKSLVGRIKVENRKFPRLHLELKVQYAPLKPGELPQPSKSTVKDLGAGGMAMTTKTPLEIDQLLTLILYLPPLNPDRNAHLVARYDRHECEPVVLCARVLWVKEDPSGRYVSGLSFYDIDSKNKKRLKHFLVDFELDQIF